MRFRAYIDGASRGNPGPAGAGVYVEADENRPAEELSADSVDLLSDSLLLVQQMNGNFRVKAEHLKPLCSEAFQRAKRFRHFSIRHVRREKNKDADRLANLGADASERPEMGP